MKSCQTKLFLLLVTTLYSAILAEAATPAEPWVRGQWNIDEGKGDTLTDQSRYGNHGMATRASWVRTAIVRP